MLIYNGFTWILYIGGFQRFAKFPKGVARPPVYGINTPIKAKVIPKAGAGDVYKCMLMYIYSTQLF